MLGKVLIVGLFIGLMGFTGASRQMTPVIEVSCPEKKGCFRLIEQAVDAAPVGAKLHVAAGVYYEKRITIIKNLTLTFDSENDDAEVRFIDLGPGILIEHKKDTSPLEVSLIGGTFISNVPTQFDFIHGQVFTNAEKPATISIENPQKDIDSLKVSIEGISIRGYFGILAEFTQLSIKNSDVQTDASSVFTFASKVELIDNTLSGGLSTSFFTKINVQLTNNVEALLKDNRITSMLNFGVSTMRQWGVLLELKDFTTVPEERLGNTFEGNVFDAEVGVVLTGAVDAEFNYNQFINNSVYGFSFAEKSCLNSQFERALVTTDNAFQGTLTGRGNVFMNNDTDVCPPDAVLPEGFMIPTN